MNTDPDFHPLTAAWLDGTATPPEQQLLGEILHTPIMMSDYAALCHTETLLRQHSRPAAQRREALAQLLAAPPWPWRMLRFCRRPAVRWSAAAAVAAALLTWTLWPADSSGPSSVVVKPKPSPRLMPAASPARDLPGDATAVLPPADKSVEPWLRNYYVRPIPLSGELAASVRALAAEIKMSNGQPLAVDPQTNGDAPVYLKTSAALPAWTVLEILALQSGAEAVVSGKQVVFRNAKKPLPLDGRLHEDQPRSVLMAALGNWSAQGFDDEWEAAGFLAKETIGSPLKFWPNGDEIITFNGTSRAVWALGKICRASPRAPQRLQWSANVLKLPHGLFEKALAENCPGRMSTANGLFLSDTEHQMLLRALSMQQGVDLMTLPIPVSDSGTRVKWTSNPEGLERTQDELSAVLEGTIDSSGSLDVIVALKMEKWNESTRGWSTQDLTCQVMIQPGQTIVLGGLVREPGMESVHLISAQIIDTTGPPKPDPPKESAREELPYAIPVVDKPGMVQSPYAPEKGFIDVEGFKRGTRVECPYSGKHFRVP
jgi:hypothetical protein